MARVTYMYKQGTYVNVHCRYASEYRYVPYRKAPSHWPPPRSPRRGMGGVIMSNERDCTQISPKPPFHSFLRILLSFSVAFSPTKTRIRPLVPSKHQVKLKQNRKCLSSYASLMRSLAMPLHVTECMHDIRRVLFCPLSGSASNGLAQYIYIYIYTLYVLHCYIDIN